MSGSTDEAEPLLLSGHAAMQQALGEQHGRTRNLAGRLARLYEAWGRPDEAAKYRALADAGDGSESP